MTKRLALIDTDIVVHKACFYHEYRMDEDDPALRQTCLDTALDLVLEWCSTAGCHIAVPLYTPPGSKTFRHEVYPEYKANRKDKAGPIYKQDCFDYIRDNLGLIGMEGIEADDIMGILATDPDILEQYEPVIVTIDKDLAQVPGLHFNPDKDIEVRQVSKEQALDALYVQVLMGDSTDNIPGIPKVGIKTAEKIVASWNRGEDERSYYDLAYNFYASKGFDDDYFSMNYDLVKIYTVEDKWNGAPQLKQYIDEHIQDRLKIASRLGTKR